MPRLTTRFGAASSFALALAGVLFISSAASASNKLWTEQRRGRDVVKIPSISPLVEKATPASLVIYTEREVGKRHLPPGHPQMHGPGGMMQGEGSGFLIHPSGYALTNNHVIEHAQVIRVRVGTEQTEIEAEVVGTDPKTDVALIKLKSKRKNWPVMPLGDSDALEVGDFVVAIGNPFGLAQTVSMGILSARGRKDIVPSARTGLYDFLQTDASINPGNSGGPLLNLRGEVVGINTAVNAAAQGIGFAIPVNMVKRILPDLAEKGSVARAWIGVGIQRISPDLAKGFGLERPMGALVRQVVDDGPAAAAGLEPGDIITHFDGRAIDDANSLPLIAGDAGVGKKVTLKLVRNGSAKNVALTLGAHPDNQPRRASKAHAPAKAKKRPTKLGLSVVSLNGDDRRRLELEASQQGVRVIETKPGSAAMEAGLFPDDVIVRLNGKKVEDAQVFAQTVKDTKKGEVLRMFVLRDGASLFVAMVKP